MALIAPIVLTATAIHLEYSPLFECIMAEDIRRDKIQIGHLFGSYFAIEYAGWVVGLRMTDRVATCRSYFRGMIQILDHLKKSSDFSAEAGTSSVKYGLGQLSHKRTSGSDVPEFGYFGKFIHDGLSFDSILAVDEFRYASHGNTNRSKVAEELFGEEFWKWESRKASRRLFEIMATFHKLYFESDLPSRKSGWTDANELLSQLNVMEKLDRSLGKEPVVTLFNMVLLRCICR